MNTPTPPDQPAPPADVRAALLEMIAALPDEAVERLWRFVPSYGGFMLY
jgi:hypothetical protein